MSSYHAYDQHVPIDEALHQRIIAKLGPEPLEGLVVHIVARLDDGTLRYTDVWTSREACDRAFRERIHPAVAAVFAETGFRPGGEPARAALEVIHVSGPADRPPR